MHQWSTYTKQAHKSQNATQENQCNFDRKKLENRTHIQHTTETTNCRIIWLTNYHPFPRVLILRKETVLLDLTFPSIYRVTTWPQRLLATCFLHSHFLFLVFPPRCRFTCLSATRKVRWKTHAEEQKNCKSIQKKMHLSTWMLTAELIFDQSLPKSPPQERQLSAAKPARRSKLQS